jgi:hypothetical protein
MRLKIVPGFLLYGFIVGSLSAWWWGISDSILVFNIPGVLLGDEVYSYAIRIIGNPVSPQAHYTIPWILRVPQVYVPVSMIFWGLAGVLIQLIYTRMRRRDKR